MRCGTRVSAAFFESPDFATPSAIRRAGRLGGRTVDALDAAHLDLCLGRLSRDVVEEDARFGLLHVLIEHDAHDHILIATEAATDADPIAFANLAVGLGGVVVDGDLAAFTRALRFRACLEEAGHVEPDVKANRV